MGKNLLAKLLGKYANSEFLKNSLILFSGTSLSQLLPFVLTPFLSRFYTDSQFGVVFLYMSIVSVLSVVVTLKYEISIVLPKSDESAKYLLLTSLLLSFIISFILYLLILPGKGALLMFFDKEGMLGNWVYAIPISVFCLGVVQSLNYWLNRISEFKPISGGKVIKSVSTVGVQSSLTATNGWLRNNGLVGGLLTGHILQVIYLVYNIVKKKVFVDFKFSFYKMKKVALYYQEIPMYNATSGMVNMLSNNLPIFLFATYFGSVTVGLFGMALRMVATPMGMVNSAIGEVFYSKASKLYNTNQEQFMKFTRSTTLHMFKLVVVPFVLLFLFAPQIFKFILGDSWVEAGKYTQVLLPWLMLVFVNAHLTALITIFRIQKEYLIFSVVFLVFRFVAIYSGYYIYRNIYYSLAFYSAVGVVFNLIMMFFLLKKNSKLIIGK